MCSAVSNRTDGGASSWSDGWSGRVPIDGVALEIALFGPPPQADGKPVVMLLHEGLGCVALWRDFPARLAALTGAPVLAWSRRGYGASDLAELPRPLDYMTGEAEQALPALLDWLDAPSFVLAGHSDGASIAALYAGGRSDDRLAGLVLIAPHFFTEEAGLASIAEARTAYQTTDLPARLGKYHADADHCFYGWNDAWLDPGFKSWNIEACLPTISVPILFVQGAEDQYGSLAQLETVRQNCPARLEELILPDCRHSPHIEQPEALLAGFQDFLDGLG